MANPKECETSLSRVQRIYVLLLPLVIGALCCAGIILVNPSDEATGRLWVVMPPFCLTIIARPLAQSETPRRREAGHHLYWGIALYCVVLLLLVGLGELFEARP
jgi:hypothetical protein